MDYLYLVPQWFFGLDILMELLFAFVTALVAYYSLKISSIADQREPGIFGMGFLLIAFSYIIKALVNLFVLTNIEHARALSLANLDTIGLIGVYAHIFLFTAGLVTIAYITLKVKSVRVYTMLLLLSIGTIIFNDEKALAFNLISSFLLVFITINYVIEYTRNKNAKTALVAIAFFGLLLSGLGFIIAPTFYGNYVLDQSIEFVAYILIAISLVLIRKH